MHRHTRIHTKEESLNALGAKFQMRRGKSAWRQRINNFINHAQANNPISERMKPFPPMSHDGMSRDGIPGLPNHSSHSLFTHHREHMPPMFPGMKRPAGPPDFSSEWALPFKRQTLPGDIERREADVEKQEISPVKYDYQLLPDRDEEETDDKGDNQVIMSQLMRKGTFVLSCEWSFKWAASWQNQQNGMCAQQRLRSAWASTQSDQSLHCPHEAKLPIECTVKTDQTVWMPRLIWVLAGGTVMLLVLSWGGSDMHAQSLSRVRDWLLVWSFFWFPVLWLERTVKHWILSYPLSAQQRLIRLGLLVWSL